MDIGRRKSGAPAQKVCYGKFVLCRKSSVVRHSSSKCGFSDQDNGTLKPDRNVRGSWISTEDNNRISLIHTSSLICLNHC